LCNKFCDDIKEVQTHRLVEAGYSTWEADKEWFGRRDEYLKHWREYIAGGLVSLPKGLDRLLHRDINNYMGVALQ